MVVSFYVQLYPTIVRIFYGDLIGCMAISIGKISMSR